MEKHDTNYLEHHGILGQKWGVRRFQRPDGTRTSAGKKRAKQYQTVSQEADEILKNRNKYSDQELQSKVNRLNSAARLRDIAGKDPEQKGSLLDRYTNVAKKVLLVSATTSAVIAAGKKVMSSDNLQKALDTTMDMIGPIISPSVGQNSKHGIYLK